MRFENIQVKAYLCVTIFKFIPSSADKEKNRYFSKHFYFKWFSASSVRVISFEPYRFRSGKVFFFFTSNRSWFYRRLATKSFAAILSSHTAYAFGLFSSVISKRFRSAGSTVCTRVVAVRYGRNTGTRPIGRRCQRDVNTSCVHNAFGAPRA